MLPPHLRHAVLGATLIGLCAACATVPPVQHVLTLGRDGIGVDAPLPCNGGAMAAGERAAVPTLRSPELRVLSWNLHKNGDPGWHADLVRFAAVSDLLLIQEAALTAELQRTLHDAAYDWLLANAFMLHDHATGVLSAARVRPASACVQRSFEPLLRLPKSAAITRYALQGTLQTLVVANVHSINFTLGLRAYRAQLDAIARELADHRGPVIVAGDFNTWSAPRLAIARDVMKRLGLVPVLPPIDTRSRVFGHQVDYVFVRGLDVISAEAPEVHSSDHNPVLVTLRLAAVDAAASGSPP